jgi:hypothetical protein
MSDDVGDIVSVRQRLYQAVRNGETYAGPVWSSDLYDMLQEFDNQAEYIKKIAERLHAADVWLHMHTMVDHSCEECRVFFRTTLAAQKLLKMDDHRAEARARLAPDKRREAWSASANKIMATVLASDIDIVLVALTDVEKRLEAALELNRIGGSHTYHCQSGAGGGGCDDECARLRKVMLGGDV